MNENMNPAEYRKEVAKQLLYKAKDNIVGNCVYGLRTCLDQSVMRCFECSNDIHIIYGIIYNINTDDEANYNFKLTTKELISQQYVCKLCIRSEL